MKKPDITAIITFHREGRLAHVSLNSIARTRAAIEKTGVVVELVCILDRADAYTKEIVSSHPAKQAHDLTIEVSYGDPAASRNRGVQASGGSLIAIFDGDDLHSENWLEQAFQCHQSDGGQHIYHPELTVSFEALKNYCFAIDQRSSQFDARNLLMANYWTSCAFAIRQIFIDYPYAQRTDSTSGFGFEDWHWNCETVGGGVEHRVVPGTALFYRRKNTNSVNASNKDASRIMHPSRLFSLYSDIPHKPD